jgi:hypothetical protein
MTCRVHDIYRWYICARYRLFVISFVSSSIPTYTHHHCAPSRNAADGAGVGNGDGVGYGIPNLMPLILGPAETITSLSSVLSSVPPSTSTTPLPRGLYIRTMIKPTMIKIKNSMHFLRPVLAWYRAASFSSDSAATSSREVCWTLYSTESRTVPCSTTRLERSRNRSASSEMEVAIWVI